MCLKATLYIANVQIFVYTVPHPNADTIVDMGSKAFIMLYEGTPGI